MPRVDIPNVGAVDFPDTMSHDEIVHAIQTKILPQYGKAQAAPAAPTAEMPDRSLSDIGSDIVTGAAKGITSGLQGIVGLADIPTGGEAGKALKPYLDLEKLQEGYSQHYSPQQQAAIKAVQEAKGFGGTLEAYAENPAAIASTIGESIPSMLVGGALGKGAQAIRAVKGAGAAGALGEGLIGAGSAAESLREQSPDELLSGKGTVAALGAGIGTSMFGLAGAKLADKFGVVDPDTLITGGLQALKSESVNAGEAAAKKSFLKQMVGSGISEGFFEEMPQSAQEQMWANFANDKPLTEGIGEAAASGLVAGAAMGVGAGGIGGGFNTAQLPPQDTTPPPAEGATPPTPPKEDETAIMTPTVEALTPEAKAIEQENLLREKEARVRDWLGTDKTKLFREIMAQDFDTHEGLDKVEELLGGTEDQLGTRGLGIATKDLPLLRNKIDTQPEQPAATQPEQPAATQQEETRSFKEEPAPEVHPDIVAAQSALDAYGAKPNVPANVRAVNEVATNLGIGGAKLEDRVTGLQNAVAQAQAAQPEVAAAEQQVQPEKQADFSAEVTDTRSDVAEPSTTAKKESIAPDEFTTDQSREEFGQKLGAKVEPSGRLVQAPNPKLETAMRWLKGQARTGTVNRRATYRDISMGHALDALDASPNLIIRQLAEKAKNQLKDIGFDFGKTLHNATGQYTWAR